MIDVKSFIRRGIEKDTRTLEIEEIFVKNTDEDYKNEVRILKTNFLKRNKNLFKHLLYNGMSLRVKTHEVLFKKGSSPNANNTFISSFAFFILPFYQDLFKKGSSPTFPLKPLTAQRFILKILLKTQSSKNCLKR